MDDLQELKNKIRLVDYIQGTGAKIKNLGGRNFWRRSLPYLSGIKIILEYTTIQILSIVLVKKKAEVL